MFAKPGIWNYDHLVARRTRIRLSCFKWKFEPLISRSMKWVLQYGLKTSGPVSYNCSTISGIFHIRVFLIRRSLFVCVFFFFFLFYVLFLFIFYFLFISYFIFITIIFENLWKDVAWNMQLSTDNYQLSTYLENSCMHIWARDLYISNIYFINKI